MAEKKKSLKPIPPTMRGKKRYIEFQLIASAEISQEGTKNAVFGVFERLFGEAGIASQKLWMVKWLKTSNTGILRCSLSQEENVKAGLLFVTRAGGTGVVPLVKRVSGSIRKLARAD